MDRFERLAARLAVLRAIKGDMLNYSMGGLFEGDACDMMPKVRDAVTAEAQSALAEFLAEPRDSERCYAVFAPGHAMKFATAEAALNDAGNISDLPQSTFDILLAQLAGLEVGSVLTDTHWNIFVANPAWLK